jgi:hypothetical protein
MSMPSVTAVTSPVLSMLEFFTQSRAERVVRAYAPVQRERIARHVRAADSRLSAGRRAAHPVPASLLLRDAVVQLQRAIEAARDPDVDDQAFLAGAARELPMPVLPPDPARPRADPSDDTRVRAALSSYDPLYFDGLRPEDVERTRWALDRVATLLRRRVEARSLEHVRATRWGRWAAVGLLLVWGLVAFARARLLPRDIALGKPVHPSSQKQSPPDGQTIVDGDTGTSVGVHTSTEDNPNVVIDLEAPYWLSSIKVYNRMDGWFDDCLPLVVEVSLDGKSYDEIARRETHFGTRPPWIVDVGGRPGRYVRLRVARKSYLALSEVEVFGKKQ